jgi:hypothetical protein
VPKDERYRQYVCRGTEAGLQDGLHASGRLLYQIDFPGEVNSMTENRGSESLQEITAHWVLPFMEPQKIYGQRYCEVWIKVWGIGGQETPAIPHEPGGLDAEYTLRSVGG